MIIELIILAILVRELIVLRREKRKDALIKRDDSEG